MNTLTKTILVTVAMSAAATALSSQAADQSAFFEQQRMLTDGYTAPFNVVPTKRSMTPATPYQAAETKWLTAELARGPGSLPTPFPVPEKNVAVAKAPSKESAQFEAFEHQLPLTDGTAQSVTPAEHVVAGK
jgi:hypothetical protein